MPPQQFGELGDVPITDLARLLDAIQVSMIAEGISDAKVRRVRNRLIWGNPDGADAVIRLDSATAERIPDVRST